ncbi:MAG: hypothetical protein M3Y86_11155 [Verrucomicrobiota bacterium]|nr:hypothetical protein [Verrucomicrobiota bacterium]
MSKQIRPRVSRFLGAILSLILLCPAQSDARTFMEFLHAVGNSIVHPQHHEKSRPNTRTTKRSTAKNSTAPESSHDATANVSPAPGPTTEVTATVQPTPLNTPAPEPIIRVAQEAGGSKSSRRDLPYAVPVPNRAGFVTSPYAPKQGLVDVRSFPSGTEVKDPYTGKIFRTP